MSKPESVDNIAPHRLLPLLGWLVGSLFFFYAWILRVSPSVMVEAEALPPGYA